MHHFGTPRSGTTSGCFSSLRDDGMGVLITDHNVRETLSITNRSYIIVDGRIFQHGPAKRLVNDEMVRKAYLGNRFSLPELDDESDVAADKDTPQG